MSEKRGDEIEDLTPEDEAILDRVWAAEAKRDAPGASTPTAGRRVGPKAPQPKPKPRKRYLR